MGFLSKLRTNDRLNYGTLGSGRTDYQTPSTATTMPTQTAPAYNEGIQTLVNTYTPPTDISSQVDGIRTIFTVPAYNTSENINLRVYYNGQRLTTGIDIIISTATTFRMTFAPVNGSELVVDYKPQ